jgi:hypothetical protein
MHAFITPLRRAAAAALVLSLSAVGAHAVEAWSTAASAGTVDEASTKLLSLESPTVQFKTSKTGTATVRYPLHDLFVDPANPSPKWLGMRFRDDGPDARITAQLFQQDHASGVVTPISPLVDSDTVSPQAGFQFLWRSNCAMALNFFQNTYWVEVTLARATTAGNPAVQQVRMDNVSCSAAESEGAMR